MGGAREMARPKGWPPHLLQDHDIKFAVSTHSALTYYAYCVI